MAVSITFASFQRSSGAAFRVVVRKRKVVPSGLRADRITGRPPKHAAKNLLAGLATCAWCGGGLVVEQSNNRKGRYSYYVCLRRWHHGTCTNRLRVPVSEMNEAILQAIEEHALTPEAVEYVVQATERDDVEDRELQLRREQENNDKRIKNLQAAIEVGGDAITLVARVHELEAQQCAIADELANLAPLPRLALVVINDRLAEWRRLLRGSTTQGRAVLQRVISGRIVFTPRDDGGYDFSAETRFDRLFSGVVVPMPDWLKAFADASRGMEDIGPEDTFDGDYGRLLERVYKKGWRARQDSNLRPSA